MAKRLKGMILGITNIVVEQGKRDERKIAEVQRLLEFLYSKNIQPVFFANRIWVSKDDDGKNSVQLQDTLSGIWKNTPWIISQKDGTPPKPTKESTEYLLNRFGWDPAEVVYVGNTEEDMLAALHGNVLFLNATWYNKNTDYGILFDSPKDVARFVDTFCLRKHLWHYAIERDDFRFYSLAPYSTRMPEFAFLSDDAKAAAKWGGGHPDFWTKYLWSTIYFSELYKEINYIAVYPGHMKGSGNPIMETPMLAFSKCFHVTYLRDFIVRHSAATKSSYARTNNVHIDHLNQLNTIMLEKHPLRSTGTQSYRTCPVKSGKTILLIDDICTNGYSLEAARAFIKQTGADVICLSWLKTINSDYIQIPRIDRFEPFKPNTFTSVSSNTHQYRDFIADPFAPQEVTKKLRAYDSWVWP